MARAFDFLVWDYDESGEAAIFDAEKYTDFEKMKRIAESELFLEVDDVLEVYEGVCKYSVGYDDEGNRCSGYVAGDCEHEKRPKGWFNVWIVKRKERDE